MCDSFATVQSHQRVVNYRKKVCYNIFNKDTKASSELRLSVNDEKKDLLMALQIEVIHNFKEKLPLWFLHRLHQSESVRRPNMKAKTMFQKIKVGEDK